MKFLNKMKKNQKGFTLVEIIVVLVILAVLAAFTIPTMLGFVNEAKGKAYLAEAREVYVAAQATATEYTANGTGVATDGLNSTKVYIASPTGASKAMKNYIGDDLSYMVGTTSTNPVWTVTLATSGTPAKATGKVTKVEYKKGGYTVTLENGKPAVVVKN